MLKSFKIYTCTNSSLGLHLSRAPWDPYPWVSSIQKESTSYAAGLRVGDCLLEMNGSDVLGLKISEIAGLLKNHWLNESSNHVNVVIWRNKAKDTTAMDASDADDASDEDEENNAHNINQQSLQKFATCLQHIAQLLECPVCLEVVKPPGWQCCNGHVLCNNCRSRSEKCPVCRVPLGPRGRCLLSDKLFTLLAESFPCDGVRSNKNSPKDRRKCSTEFHSQPKMAIVQKHLQDQLEDDDAKAKDFKKTEHEFILRSLRIGRRRRTKSKKDDAEDGHQLQRQQSLQGVLNAVVQIKCDDNSSRKFSQDFCRSVGVTQVSGGNDSEGPLSAPVPSNSDELLDVRNGLRCHCRMCYKPTKEVAIVNNVMTATTTTTTPNKYILQVRAEQQSVQHHPQHRQELQCGVKKYQNYQCPTGKLCCLQLKKNVMSPHAQNTATQVDTASYQVQQLHQHHLHVQQPMTNNNLPTTGSSGGGVSGGHLYRTLQNEWEILAHLTQDHQSAVNQYYAEFGQRIAITHDALHDKSVICLNLRGRGGNQPQNTNIEKFFVAFVPLAEEQQHNCHPQPQHQNVTSNSNYSTGTTKVAVFVWHMNALPNRHSIDGHSDSLSSPGDVTGDCDDEVSNFDAIIENPKTGIKWFGRAHCLTTPWSQIYPKQHFLMHEVMEEQTTTTETAAHAFVIVIKEKS